MEDNRNNGKWSRVETAFVVACLLCMSIVMFAGIQQLSPTNDEPVHIVSGLALWQMHDTRLNPEHPPLMKMLAAYPIRNSIIPDYRSSLFCSRGLCEWYFSKTQFENDRMQSRLNRARIPMILITVLTGWMIYMAARRLGGATGAILALIVYCTSPFFLGYGPLVSNDVLLSLTVLTACLTVTDLLLTQTWKDMLWASLALAAAWLTKFTAILLFPAFGSVWLWNRWSDRSNHKIPKRSPVKAFVSFLLSFIYAYCIYAWMCGSSNAADVLAGRQVDWSNDLSFHAMTNDFVQLWRNHATLEFILRPLWLYLTGIFSIGGHGDLNGYVMGGLPRFGGWYYFPVAFLFKMPLTLLFMLALTIILFVLLVKKAGWNSSLNFLSYEQIILLRFIVVAAIVFGVGAELSKIHIGMRHIAVTILMCHVLVAMVPRMIAILYPDHSVPLVKGLIATMAIIGLSTCIMAFPNYIAYFNPLRGQTPKQEIVNDSNLEWGQGYIRLAEFQKEKGLKNLYVYLNTQVEPQIYLSSAKSWSCDQKVPPDAEWLVVSADFMVWNGPGCKYLFQLSFLKLQEESIYLFKVPLQHSR